MDSDSDLDSGPLFSHLQMRDNVYFLHRVFIRIKSVEALLQLLEIRKCSLCVHICVQEFSQ